MATTPDIEALMAPFAAAILAKARALKKLNLSRAHRSRLRESISDDLKKASNFHLHGMSVAAHKKAASLKIEGGLSEKTWHEQHAFDPGRKIFLAEHMVTVSTLRERCLRAVDKNGVLAVLTRDIRVVWILRSEDRKLTALKFRSQRPEPAIAYEQARIEIWAPSRIGSGSLRPRSPKPEARTAR